MSCKNFLAKVLGYVDFFAKKISPLFFGSSILVIFSAFSIALNANDSKKEDVVFIDLSQESTLGNEEQVDSGVWQTVELTPPALKSDADSQASLSDLMLVGFVEGSAGYTYLSDNVLDDTLEEGAWTDGRAVFYARGKVLGKYLLELSYDSKRESFDPFSKIDPEEYYPVLGDMSQVVRGPIRTANKLYVAITSDDLKLVYGQYKLDLKSNHYVNIDSEFSGLYLAYKIKDAGPEISEIGLEYFQSDSTQTFSEDYLLSTGGYVYYLSKANVLPGTVNGYIEVRQSNSGVLVSKYPLKADDYTVDYSSGRVTLNTTVSSILYNRHSLQVVDDFTNSVYVWFTYESSQVDDSLAEGAEFFGGRAYVDLADYLRVGGTYVEKKVGDKKLRMQSVDVSVDSGDTEFYAEYARSNFSSEVNTSSDGGLTYKASDLNQDNEDKDAFYIQGHGSYMGDALKIDVLAVSETLGFTTLSGNSLRSQGKRTIDGHLAYKTESSVFGYRAQSNYVVSTETAALSNKNSKRRITHKLYADSRLSQEVKLGAVYTLQQIAKDATGTYQNATQTIQADLSFDSRDSGFFSSIGIKGDLPPATEGEDHTARIHFYGKSQVVLDDNFIFNLSADYDQASQTATYAAGLTYLDDGFSVGVSSRKVAGSDMQYSLNGRYQITPHFSLGGTKTIGSEGYSGDVVYRPNRRLELGVGLDAPKTNNKSNTVGVRAAYRDGNLELKSSVKNNKEEGVVVGGDIVYREGDLFVIKGGVKKSASSDNVTTSASAQQQADASGSKYLGFALGDNGLSVSGNKKISDTGGDVTTLSANYKKNDNQTYSVSYTDKRSESASQEDSDALTLKNSLELGGGLSMTSSVVRRNYEASDKVRTEQAYQLSRALPSGTVYGLNFSNYQDRLKEVVGKEGWTAKISSNHHSGDKLSASIESGEVIDLEHKVIDRFLVNFDYAHKSKSDLPKEFSRFAYYIRFNYSTDTKKDNSKTEWQSFKVAWNENLNPDLTLHLSVDHSLGGKAQDNQSSRSRSEDYTKYTVGFAYRPVANDDINVVGLARWLEQGKDTPSDSAEFDASYYEAMVFAVEAAWQVDQMIQLSQKLAYRYQKEKAFQDDQFIAENYYLLWGSGVKLLLGDEMDLSLRYAMRYQDATKDTDHNFGVNVNKDFQQFVLSAGYDYNKFDTNLTSVSQVQSGPYVRVSGIVDESLW